VTVVDQRAEARGLAQDEEALDLSRPPHSLQAELAVLGPVLKFGLAIADVLPFLKPQHFYGADTVICMRRWLPCSSGQRRSTTTRPARSRSTRAPTSKQADCSTCPR